MSLNKIKFIARTMLALSYYKCGLYKNNHKGKLLIITYHRILPKKTAKALDSYPGMVVYERSFKSHIDFLSRNYKIISMNSYLSSPDYFNENSNSKYCIITFDDGWRDNYDFAYPILLQNRIPATIFLTTGYIDTTKIFWPEKICSCINNLADNEKIPFTNFLPSLKLNNNNLIALFKKDNKGGVADKIIWQLKSKEHNDVDYAVEALEKAFGKKTTKNRAMLSWKEVDEMSNNGIEFGSHGVTHRILTSLSNEEVTTEVVESQRCLLSHKINYTPVFCYPNGNFNPSITKIVCQNSYKAEATVTKGVNTLDVKEFNCLKRISIPNDIVVNNILFSYYLSKFT